MMTVDTNVLVRYLAKDDEVQAIEATQLLNDNECFVLQAVLLEVVWVLCSKNGHNWERASVIERVRHLLSLPGILVQQPATISQALHWYGAGMDFADALHLANTVGPFATFDRRLSSKASSLKTPQQVLLLGKDVH